MLKMLEMAQLIQKSCFFKNEMFSKYVLRKNSNLVQLENF